MFKILVKKYFKFLKIKNYKKYFAYQPKRAKTIFVFWIVFIALIWIALKQTDSWIGNKVKNQDFDQNYKSRYCTLLQHDYYWTEWL